MNQHILKNTVSVTLAIALFSMSQLATGQEKKEELKKEVEVVRPYEPNVSEVYKINEIPQIKHQETEKPVFDYTIKPTPVFSTFQVQPVQPARIKSESGPQLGNGLLHLGIGNYKTPYGELFFNGAAAESTNYGFHLKHLSSHGKIRLKNSDKVKAPESDNEVSAYMNHFFNDSTALKAKLFLDRQGFRYYGYTGEKADPESRQQLIPFWNQKQAVTAGGIDLQLNGNGTGGVDYSAMLNFLHYGSKTGQNGNLLNLGGQLNKDFDQFKGRLDALLTVEGTDSVYSGNESSYGRREKAVLELSPSVLFENEMASLKLGVNGYIVSDDDRIDHIMLTPVVKASWSPVENWFTVFAGTEGYLQQNHFLNMVRENQFVTPYQNIKNTKYRYILSGGFRGRVTNELNYKFQADYASVRSDHFYVLRNRYSTNNLLTTRSNTFDVVYDNVKRASIGGEVHYATSDMLDFLLKGTYYSYDMEDQAEAWQRPGFEASASVRFKPEGPFNFTADIFYTGDRKGLIEAQKYDEQSQSFIPYPEQTLVLKMDAILDLNFSIEYEFTNQLSFWGRVNNFSAEKYDRWMGYTSKGVNFLLGLSYSF